MTYSVFVQSTSEQGYNAIVLGLPFLRAEGATKKEAIDKVQKLLARLMTSGEIVHVEVEESSLQSDDEPLLEADSPRLWQKLESLSAILRVEALSDGQTVADILNKLPEIRREVFEELYGEKQVEAWEKEWKNGE